MQKHNLYYLGSLSDLWLALSWAVIVRDNASLLYNPKHSQRMFETAGSNKELTKLRVQTGN